MLNAGAWTAVDACESDPDRAFRTNAHGRAVGDRGGPRSPARTCVHVSTDYVFDGTKAEPYHEWDDPNPQSVYGRSKLGGEREADPSHTIVRTSWVCGAHGPNMVKTVLALLDQPELAFVDDQRGCPSFTADLAPAHAPARRRPDAGHLPRHQPGRHHLVRVRARHPRGWPAPTPPRCARSPPPTSIRRGRRPGPPTRCSTTPPSAMRASRCCPHYRDALDRLVRELRS